VRQHNTIEETDRETFSLKGKKRRTIEELKQRRRGGRRCGEDSLSRGRVRMGTSRKSRDSSIAG